LIAMGLVLMLNSETVRTPLNPGSIWGPENRSRPFPVDSERSPILAHILSVRTSVNSDELELSDAQELARASQRELYSC